MLRGLVIADDVSGAAEIAGIGTRYGLPARVLREPPRIIESGLTVLDTDSRSLSAEHAQQRVGKLIAALEPSGVDLVFKKTDSALRGNVLIEVETLMSWTPRPAALLVAQNPSRGRTITAGEYRIGGVPLHQTEFARDPEHPAHTCDVLKLLAPSSRSHDIRAAVAGQFLPAGRFTIGEASNARDVRHWAQHLAPHVLPAGGADFFEAILEHRGLRPTRPFLDALPEQASALFVCGSAVANADQGAAEAAMRGGVPLSVLAMPRDLPAAQQAAEEAAIERWVASLSSALQPRDSRAMMTIGRHVQGGSQVARQLEHVLAEVVARVFARCPAMHLLIEGGATASAVCRRLGWNQLSVSGEFACGVVLLRPPGAGAGLVVKPGSYPWPAAIWNKR